MLFCKAANEEGLSADQCVVQDVENSLNYEKDGSV